MWTVKLSFCAVGAGRVMLRHRVRVHDSVAVLANFRPGPHKVASSLPSIARHFGTSARQHGAFVSNAPSPSPMSQRHFGGRSKRTKAADNVQHLRPDTYNVYGRIQPGFIKSEPRKMSWCKRPAA